MRRELQVAAVGADEDRKVSRVELGEGAIDQAPGGKWATAVNLWVLWQVSNGARWTIDKDRLGWVFQNAKPFPIAIFVI